MTLSAAPERWRADWDDIVQVYQLADAAGIEFILPIAKWRGLGGKADMWGRSFETFTHSAAAGAITKRIGVFVTAHVPITSPAFAAKAITTIDHVTHGRAGLNIVCGWNPDEFDIHGATIDSNRRYDQGLEWFKIFAKMCAGEEPFDWDSEFYKLRGVATDPLPVQRPRPPIMSAGISSAGREFAAQAADILFTSLTDLERGAAPDRRRPAGRRAARPQHRRLHPDADRLPVDPQGGRGFLLLLRRGAGRRGGARLFPPAKAWRTSARLHRKSPGTTSGSTPIASPRRPESATPACSPG